ncbi:MAG: tRNA (N6-threonylcarbamoyladenosine(37)-N6)-methyltransferase TrmO [Nitrobacter sp. 62-13]|jgi:tRNA-Thr(GGU) m(6)t(6)A37 methyltransferase TsaA|uniref:tRNA (N6-threonylcarbamoyladenosine(37)-N6)-methyltransferase TrmO n=1 Tax=Nitrobacter sp. 62-13 TaxID=1895797 RepID=UPI000961EB5C|nr:tRNA (N6-threonylcarbamoyladenosine(37)-N6)-methyltransferase TrmO [Nitrobacter sp. 62-13]OJU27123.1 MAG: tRNA (N6-threonylcarbamoyladenosine(37)-N6)-methyltransferase TrmO [Nitrobacter sp. 62-13]
MQSVGTVRSPYRNKATRISRRDIVAEIVVREDLERTLTGIEEWSHLFILFWMDQFTWTPDQLTVHPRHREDLPEVGVFSARGRERPNPIGLAVVELLKRDKNVLTVKALDAYDGTPVLDIKPYDAYDAITGLRAPEWWLMATGRLKP